MNNRLHQFRHNQKAIEHGEQGWQVAQDSGLLDRQVHHLGNALVQDQFGHQFINLVSCSYLGLDVNSQIIQGATAGIIQAGTLAMGSSRLRVRMSILDEAENGLASLFQATILTNVSCGVTTCGVLPLITSGHLTDAPSVTTVFDKHAHFCINIAKPICADEGEVLTCPHNDLNFLEDICKKRQHVAYVCDGVYSLGDKAPIVDLLKLQEKYGLFLCIDDSHGLSVYGKHGEGLARSTMTDLGPRTMIIASICKGFGTKGSILMLGAKHKLDLVKRYGGGIAWSQCLSTADCGAILASAKIHATSKLGQLQQQLQAKIRLFDSLIPSRQAGSDFPIRVIRLGEARRAVAYSKALYAHGFYAAAVFFPVTEKGQAGLRLMLRADIPDQAIQRLARFLQANLTN